MSKFGKRFLSPRDLGQYAYDLKLVEQPFQDRFLQFLEKERLLVPVCRVRYPEEIVRADWVKNHPQWEDSSLPVEKDKNRLAVVEEFDVRIGRWGQPYISPAWHHPLDVIDPAHLEFIEQDIANKPFQPWQTFKVIVGKSENGPMLGDAVDTYYHYWQIFLLAEALTMGVSVLIDLGDTEVAEKAWHGKLQDIASERKWTVLNVRGLHGIRGIVQHRAAFEALAYFLAYQNYALTNAAEGQIVNGRFRLSGEPLKAFREKEEEIAKETVKRWNLDNNSLLAFLKWQCERWAEWERHGQREVADEYKQNIRQSVYLYRILTGKDYDDVVHDVGKVTNHFRPTLEAIFPDWVKDRKESASWSLKNWIKPSMSVLAPLGHDVSDTECDELLEWIEKEGLFQFLWHFQRLTDLGQREDPISLAGIANEVGGLCSTIEHVLNYIGFPRSKYNRETMHEKMVWLWDHNQEVKGGLNRGKSKGLTSLKGSSSLLAKIADIEQAQDAEVGGQYAPIVRDLLKTVLIRNQGTHLSFTGFSLEELSKLLEVLLRSTVLIWKHARANALI